MEFEVESKCFKNATMRKEYMRMVVEAFESAQGHAELIILYQGFQLKLEEMEKSPNEYDRMVLDIIQTRYRGLHERIDESRDWVRKIIEENEERKLAE